MKPSRASRWLLAVVILIGLVGWSATGLLIYARLTYVGLFLFAGGALWAALAIRGIRLRRQARTLRASVGEVFEELFEIDKRGWPGSAWLEVLNESDLPNAAGSRLLTQVRSGRKRFFVARTLLVRRGVYSLGPTTLLSGDPFGLFVRQMKLPAANSLVVLPMSFRIAAFPPPPGILPGGKSTRQKTMDVTPHAAGVREYIPGDPMKRIHWPSTARQGRFMVREYEQDPQADIWLFLDAERSSRVATPAVESEELTQGWLFRRIQVNLPQDTFEYSVSATASLARHFLAEGRSVGLACATGKFTVVPAERGDRQIGKILETLVYLQAEGEMPLSTLVDLQAGHLPLGCGAILISACARPDLLLATEALRRRNLRPVVVAVRPETFGAPGSNQEVLAGLLQRSVPFCTLAYGDDLGAQLALPSTYFQRPQWNP